MEVKVAFFSDTHNKHKQITLPECDIAICAGDVSSVGYKHEIQQFLSWYSKQTQCTIKIFIAGNHDKCFDEKFYKEYKSPDWLPGLLLEYPNIIYLQDEQVEYFGLKIYGSPWTPWFHGDFWAFNKQRGPDINEMWNKIPTDTDIIVTHGPCAYILDYVEQDMAYAGCEQLRYKVEEIKPLIHVGGHIHLESGKLQNKIDNYKDTLYINASVLNNAYNKVAEPVLVKINVDGTTKTICDSH